MVNILHVGKVMGRIEYVATGVPLVEAFHCEHQAEKKDAVVSSRVWELVKDYFEADIRPDKFFNQNLPANKGLQPEMFAFVTKLKRGMGLRKVNVRKVDVGSSRVLRDRLASLVKHYVPSAVTTWYVDLNNPIFFQLSLSDIPLFLSLPPLPPVIITCFPNKQHHIPSSFLSIGP